MNGFGHAVIGAVGCDDAAGGLHFIRRDLISRLRKVAEAGIAVVVCSQCLYERSDFSRYQAGSKTLEFGVMEGWDMTTEAAVTKLMWALGQTDDPDELRALFRTSLAGEVTIDLEYVRKRCIPQNAGCAFFT